MEKVFITYTKPFLSIRVMSARRFVMCCFVCHALVIALSALVFVVRPFEELQRRRSDQATRNNFRDAVGALNERIKVTRSDVDSYGPDAKWRGAVTDDAFMNRVFDQISAKASGVGASVHSFERAGHGFGSEGFARVSLDTNFLQMSLFLSSLTELNLPVRVEEFEVSDESQSMDRILFSLVFSLTRVAPMEPSRCSH
jgi:hypothetical protein